MLPYTVTIAGENITELNVRNLLLTSLDVSNLSLLADLRCSGNRLTNLDVSNNTALKYLECHQNQLTSLDMSHNTALVSLGCSFNQLSAEALNALFRTLHDNNINNGHKGISIQNNPGTSTCDRSIATDKGWIVYD